MFTVVDFMFSYNAKTCIVDKAIGNFNNLGKDSYLLNDTNGIICKHRQPILKIWETIFREMDCWLIFSIYL